MKKIISFFKKLFSPKSEIIETYTMKEDMWNHFIHGKGSYIINQIHNYYENRNEKKDGE